MQAAGSFVCLAGSTETWGGGKERLKSLWVPAFQKKVDLNDGQVTNKCA